MNYLWVFLGITKRYYDNGKVHQAPPNLKAFGITKLVRFPPYAMCKNVGSLEIGHALQLSGNSPGFLPHIHLKLTKTKTTLL